VRYSDILVENLPTAPLFGVPFGMIQFEFRRDLWRQITRVPGLFYGVLCVVLYV